MSPVILVEQREEDMVSSVASVSKCGRLEDE